MSTLLSQIGKVLDRDVVTRHSYFQMKFFVVGKEPTQQSKMWRCIRELQSRQESLDAMQLELEDTEDNLALKIIVIRRTKEQSVGLTELDKEENQIVLRKEERRQKGLETTIAALKRRIVETGEEARFFMEAFEKIEEKEKLLPYDDLDSQSEYWNNKLSEELNLRMLVGQPVTYELVKTIMSLNNDSPIKREMINILEAKQAKIGEERNKLEA